MYFQEIVMEYSFVTHYKWLCACIGMLVYLLLFSTELHLYLFNFI